MNVKRLEKMVELLDGIQAEEKKRENFDIGFWVFCKGPPFCNTKACAVGYAAIDPWFKKQGLSLTEAGAPSYGDSVGWFAVEAFFDLDTDSAEYFFQTIPIPSDTSHSQKTWRSEYENS